MKVWNVGNTCFLACQCYAVPVEEGDMTSHFTMSHIIMLSDFTFSVYPLFSIFILQKKVPSIEYLETKVKNREIRFNWLFLFNLFPFLIKGFNLYYLIIYFICFLKGFNLWLVKVYNPCIGKLYKFSIVCFNI